MFKLLRKIKGQSTLEYAVLIIIVIGALLSIQVYIKRGLQGRMKSATDDIGDQYSPGNTNITRTTSTYSQTRDTFAGGKSNSIIQGDGEKTTTMSNSAIMNTQQEYWGN